MHKDESGVRAYVKHTRNASRRNTGRRLVNKGVRRNVKVSLRKDTQD